MKNPLFQLSSNNLESDGNSNRFDKTKSFTWMNENAHKYAVSTEIIPVQF